VLKSSLWKENGAFRECIREAYGKKKVHLCLTGDYVEAANWNPPWRGRVEWQGNQVLHRNQSHASRY